MMEWITLGAKADEKDGVFSAKAGDALFPAPDNRAVLFSKAHAPKKFRF